MNNKDLYESIMYKISKIVKDSLNESIMDDDFEINPSTQEIEQEYIQKQKIKEFYENDIPKDVTEYEIPYGVCEIPEKKFDVCKKLTSITIPNTVRSIGEYNFHGCVVLTSVVIPNSVQSIGEGAFQDCWSLSQVDIPNSVQSIGDKAFSFCDSLTSVVIPNSVKSIGNYAFRFCESLTSIEYDGVIYTSISELIKTLKDNGITLSRYIFSKVNLKP